MALAEATRQFQATPSLRRTIDARHPSYKWWLAVTVTLSGFLVNMSQTAIQVALPQMMTSLGLNLSQAQWVITAYITAGAILVPTVGWLGNRLGNRTLYLLSLLVFIAGSILCMLSWNASSLIFFRILQGVGGGPIAPMTMMFLSRAFPQEQRGLAMGLYGLGATFGPVVGAVIGGYLTQYVSWRMVFLFNIVPGLVCIGLAILILPNDREAERQPLDVAGLLTMAIFLVSLLVALSQGQRQGWDTPFIQRLLLIAAGSLLVFIACELTSDQPLVDLRLYANLPFAIASVLIFLFFMLFNGSNFLQIILVQRLLDYPPAQAGLVLLPGALVLSLSFPFAGRIADKCDRRVMVMGALGVFALSAYLFTFLSVDRPLSWLIGIIMLRFICGGFFFAPLISTALSHLPPEQVRMGSGLLNLMQMGFGGTIGVALATTVLQRQSIYHRGRLAEQQVFSTLNWDEVVTPIRELVHQAGSIGNLGELEVMAQLHRYLGQQALVAAYQDYFMLVAWLTLAMMPLVLCLKRPKPPT
ncbi:MAG: DHA2 family efflux MFS transporter permease subunit [bacterium]|nr:DHA2 family efflux MFS transporter permease subunit [bacterium]